MSFTLHVVSLDSVTRETLLEIADATGSRGTCPPASFPYDHGIDPFEEASISSRYGINTFGEGIVPLRPWH
jgi:hypothetical protein